MYQMNRRHWTFLLLCLAMLAGTGAALAQVPSPPQTLTATGGNGVVTLNWTAVSGATAYHVFRGTTSYGEATTPLGTPTGTTYSDTSVTNGTTYYYRLA